MLAPREPAGIFLMGMTSCLRLALTETSSKKTYTLAEAIMRRSQCLSLLASAFADLPGATATVTQKNVSATCQSCIVGQTHRLSMDRQAQGSARSYSG